MAAVCAISCLSPSDPIPDSTAFGYVDDVLSSISVKRFLELGGEEGQSYRERFVEQFRSLDEDLALLKAYLGEAIDWIQTEWRKRCSKQNTKVKMQERMSKRTRPACFCMKEGQDFATRYDID